MAKLRRVKAAKTQASNFKRAAVGSIKAIKDVHVFGKGFVCDTETRGYSRPKNLSVAEIVVNVSEGFVPLWAPNVTLRWRFREPSLQTFASPEKVKTEIRKLLSQALMKWGDAAPVKFAERDDLWDFEVVVQNGDNCTVNGCVLASAFFPDTGRHNLRIYPKMFEQERKEQVDTLIHEIGHVFGLRHFFAQLTEAQVPSEIFGTHKPFSIMNYGAQSSLTSYDRSDLKRLYQRAWSGELTAINGTPITLVQPFHTMASPSGSIVTAIRPVARLSRTARLAAAMSGGCLDLVSADAIVQDAIPNGPHDSNDTLEEAGLITANQRTTFREDVVIGVEGRGCRIDATDVPNESDTTISEARRAVRDNASQ